MAEMQDFLVLREMGDGGWVSCEMDKEGVEKSRVARCKLTKRRSFEGVAVVARCLEIYFYLIFILFSLAHLS